MRATPVLLAASVVLGAAAARAQSAVDIVDRGATRITLDGLVREWSGADALRAVDERAQVLVGAPAWHGPDDASFAFALARDPEFLWIAADVRDDVLVRSRTHAGSDDHLSVALAFYEGDALTAFELDLFPGDPGSYAGVVRFHGGSGAAVPGAEIVEAARGDVRGLSLEARIPWRALPGVREHLGALRARVAWFDADAPGRSSPHAVLGTGPGDAAHASLIPLAVGASAPLDAAALLDRFRVENGLAGVTPRLDRSVDVAGDARPERVVVFPGWVAVMGPGIARGAASAFVRLGSADPADLLDVSIRSFSGDGKSQIVLRQRVATTTGFAREVLTVYRADADGTLVPVLSHEVGRAAGAQRLVDRVSVDGGQVRIEAGAPEGFTQATWPAAAETGVEPPLTPWSADRLRVYGWNAATRTLTVQRSEPNAARPSADAGVPPTAGDAGATLGVLPPDVQGVLALFRQREGLPATAAPSHRATGDVAEDAAPEEVLVFGRSMVVAGAHFAGGRSYYSVGLPLAEGDTVLDLRLVDLTGDGKRDAVLRVRRSTNTQVQGVGVASEREMVLGYALSGDHRGRVFAAEVARRVGDRSVTNELGPLVDGQPITIRSGSARGWDAATYPFHDQPAQGFFPLLLPWDAAQRRVVYRWSGAAFERAP